MIPLTDPISLITSFELVQINCPPATYKQYGLFLCQRFTSCTSSEGIPRSRHERTCSCKYVYTVPLYQPRSLLITLYRLTRYLTITQKYKVTRSIGTLNAVNLANDQIYRAEFANTYKSELKWTWPSSLVVQRTLSCLFSLQRRRCTYIHTRAFLMRRPYGRGAAYANLFSLFREYKYSNR